MIDDWEGGGKGDWRVEEGWGAAGCTARLMSWQDCAYGVPEGLKFCVSVTGVWDVVGVGAGCGGVMGEA